MGDLTIPGGNIYGPTYAHNSAFVIQGNVQNLHASTFTTEQSCLQTFKTSDYEAHKFLIPDRAPGTCRWILSRPQFIRWQRSDCSELPCILAGPGYGKSVLAKSFVDHGIPDHTSATMCYFFFGKDHKGQDSLAVAFCAILHQFFVRQPQLLRHAVALWQALGSRIQLDVHALWKILQTAVANPSAGPVICILDALDEWCREDRQILIKMIAKLHETSQSCNGTLRLLVTGRFSGDLESVFDQYLGSYASAQLHAEEDNDEVLQEVHSVIRAEVNKFSEIYALNVLQSEKLLQTLIKLEHRTYLWWSLAIREIHNTYKYSLSPNEVSISILPVSIEETYESILNAMDPATKAVTRAVLVLMVGAQRPLNTSEMATALRWLASSGMLGPVSIDVNGPQLKRRLLQWCSPLVCVTHGRLHFIHGTVRDFLTTLEKQLGGTQTATAQWAHSIHLTIVHKTFALLCQNFRKRPCSKIPVTASFSALTEREDCMSRSQGLAFYAVAFGNFHAAEAMRRMDVYRSTFFIHRLFSFGMDLQTVDSDGRSLLHHMVDLSTPIVNESLIQSILSHGGLVEAADYMHMNCLQYAVIRADVRLFSVLLAAGFAVDSAVLKRDRLEENSEPQVCSQSNVGLTALHAAAMFGQVELLDELIKKGAKLHAVDKHGRTALHVAVMPGMQTCDDETDAWALSTPPQHLPSLLRRMSEFGEKASRWGWDRPRFLDIKERDIVARSKIQIVRSLCTASPQLVHICDNASRTALHLIDDTFGHQCTQKLTYILLENGADIKCQDMYGQTPAHYAVSDSGVERLNLLLHRSPIDYLSVTDRQGRNILHLASMMRHFTTVLSILGQFQSMAQRQKYVNDVDDYGQKPLHSLLGLGCAYGVPNLIRNVRILLAAGTRLTHKDHYGQDVLAAYLGNPLDTPEREVVEILLDHGCDASLLDTKSRTLAHAYTYLPAGSDLSILLVLQKAGVDLSKRCSEGRTILHCAAIAGTMTVAVFRHLVGCLKLDKGMIDMYEKTPRDYARKRDADDTGAKWWRRRTNTASCFDAVVMPQQECDCQSSIDDLIDDAGSEGW